MFVGVERKRVCGGVRGREGGGPLDQEVLKCGAPHGLSPDCFSVARRGRCGPVSGKLGGDGQTKTLLCSGVSVLMSTSFETCVSKQMIT